MICRDEFDTFGYVQEEEQEQEQDQEQQQQAVIDPVRAQFHPGIEAGLDDVVNTAVNGCCCIEKIIRCVIITFMFFCFIVAMNILFTIARAFRHAS